MTARADVAGQANEVADALATDEAFATWYSRTVPHVYAYLLSRSGRDSVLAEELTQQTFIAAIDQRSRFDGRSSSITWLCGIARHKLVDHYRRLERDERRQLRLEVHELEIAGDARHEPGGRDDLDAIAAAVRSLPAAQRAVLSLVVFDGLSVPEAAKLLGRSAGATQSLLHRAREGVRQALGEHDDA